MKQSVSPFFPMLTRFNLVSFWLVFGLTFVFICIKAFSLPITHDEVATALYYPQLSYVDILTLANGDQNNHILNTLTSKLCISAFGQHLWVIRLSSVLSFIVFTLAARTILNILMGIHSKFYAVGALLFVLSPYVIDFFCLSRGYGICVAFIAASVSFMLKYCSETTIAIAENYKTRYLFYSLIFAGLGCLASFSSISFLGAIITFTGVYILVEKHQRIKNYILYGLLLLLIASLLYLPLLRISEANQFSGWHSNGFFQDTLMSIVRLSLYGSKIFITTAFISYFFSAVICIGVFFSIIQYQKSNQEKSLFKNPQFVAILVLILTVLINVLQVITLNLPNLNGRIALFFYPLIVIALLACKPVFRFLHAYLKIAAVLLILIFGVHHIVHISQIDKVLEWEYDAYSLKVLNTIKARAKGQTMLLETNWLYQPSLSFHVVENKFSNIKIGKYTKDLQSNSAADFYYCKEEDYKHLSHNFNVLIKFDDNWLLKHK